jgi:outer membrane receptor protein involved in Fe transport
VDDVLVLFDGVPLADPFHLKNFQSLVSAFDPEAVERIEVYSGGFPVRYGTRSGGVINIEPRALDSGYENTLGVSLLAYDVASVGQSDRWPVDWLVTARHSVSDVVLKPVNGHDGEPQFSDTLGRLRLRFEDGSALTLGWLLLDEEIALATRALDEHADASYRDEYGWIAFEADPSGRWHSRTVVSGTWADRSRNGTLNAPGLANEQLSEEREFSNLAFQSRLTYTPRPGQSWDMSLEASRAKADLSYDRRGGFTPETAALFDRPADNTLVDRKSPRASTYAASLSHLRKWASFEAELGVRWDAQSYGGEVLHGQLSPRLNLRYDFSPTLRAYASWGRFSQAQRVDEWRTEDAQSRPDGPALANHTVLGVAYEASDTWRFTTEAYRKHWFLVTPGAPPLPLPWHCSIRPWCGVSF